MFNYTTETILNDLSRVKVLLGALTAPASGVPWDPGIEATKKAVFIQKLNKFLVAGTDDKIKDSVVYKRAYTAPVNSVASVTVPTTTSGTLYRIAVQLTTNGYPEAMFARDRVLYGKPFYVEVLGTGTAATDAATLISNWNKVVASYNGTFVAASSGGGAVVTLTASNPYIVFKSVTIESVDLLSSLATVVATGTVGTANVIPFGNWDDLTKNHRLPTLENYRPYGLNQDELPIVGATYDSYEFEYVTDRGVMDQSFLGGTGTSKTNHIIWVNKAAADVTLHIDGTAGQSAAYNFEEILVSAGLTIKLASDKSTVSVTPPTEA